MINKTRHNARRYALQALYQWFFCETKPDALISQFMEEHDLSDTEVAYFKEVVTGTIQHVAIIDELMTAHLDRKISALNPVELSVLRLSIYELLHRKEVPYKVVIDEALELVKEFGAEAGHKYVNAILDVLSSEIRKGV
ncbi:transcription antitermination factor NusB [Coxiella burnetii]|uniref:Transcription antitermination protein NusB n=1 Tax=Coxiella burnetii (strain CbuK_Q154) TaxID=434924 RepID=NUSB_COXB1|nr:transcription antitermination factor NusB [Coxiella burnetii]B6J8Q7.1 RecName: Full=Transcription antitermination protein NusB; AltName: Full=Antitermination factor NusB [Coxiella burnetii CbuK_Q154]ACJ20656.1 utilization substance protein B [Coxiella burnetii CbuK_Q154]AIT63725.1 N utilization substance protein B [Coxiella burnetii str. Namibia]ATN86271.1 antitermination protein NusB [Coxiella burnetii str. Schperling]EAX32197.1 antitermination protein NusB [Coxiella burnetii 'MSU Goat Q17